MESQDFQRGLGQKTVWNLQDLLLPVRIHKTGLGGSDSGDLTQQKAPSRVTSTWSSDLLPSHSKRNRPSLHQSAPAKTRSFVLPDAPSPWPPARHSTAVVLSTHCWLWHPPACWEQASLWCDTRAAVQKEPCGDVRRRPPARLCLALKQPGAL